MRGLLPLAAATVGFVMPTIPVRADDGAALLAKIRAATLRATSFVAQVQATNLPGIAGTLTVVLPANFKSEFRFGSTSIESYAVDGMVYVHVPDGGWQKTKADETWLPAPYLNILDRLNASQVTLLPDRKANRTIVGAFTAEVLLPATLFASAASAPQPIVCTYEKSTFLLRQCTTSSISISYAKYDDPANTVVLPDEAKNAVLVIRRAPAATSDPSTAPAPENSPTPAPAASEAPAPTYAPTPTNSPAPTASPAGGELGAPIGSR